MFTWYPSACLNMPFHLFLGATWVRQASNHPGPQQLLTTHSKSSTHHQQSISSHSIIMKRHQNSNTNRHQKSSTSSTSNVHSTTNIIHQDTSAVPFVHPSVFFKRRNASPSCGAQNGPRITELAVEAIVATTDSSGAIEAICGDGGTMGRGVNRGVNLGNMMRMDDLY